MKILSLGLGVQSTALYYQSSMGQLPRVDHAIFVDLGREKEDSYKYLEYLLRWEKANNGIPITVLKKNLFADLLKAGKVGRERFVSIPAYTKDAEGNIGMIRRQCTSEYKIAPVDRCIREFYQKRSRQRLPKTEVWKGISFDERERMSTPPEQWKVSTYPYIGYSIDYKANCVKLDYAQIKTRKQIEQWYIENWLPIPPKSSCVFCPYMSDAAWYDLKTNHPSDFEAACQVDEAIRDSTARGIKQPIYLHRSCVPLREIIFTAKASDLFHGECSGSCHN